MNRLSQEHEPVSLNGMLLVATPKIGEGLFQQAVCLVVEHGDKGSAALLLNRPILNPNFSIPGMEEPLPKVSLTGTNRLHFGGPCSGPLVALHDQAEFGEAGGGNGIYLAADFSKVTQAAHAASKHFRLIIGHSLWRNGQLEREIVDGCWYVIPAFPDLVFAPDDEMWRRGLCFVGRAIIAQVTGIKHFPASPLLN